MIFITMCRLIDSIKKGDTLWYKGYRLFFWNYNKLKFRFEDLRIDV